MTVSDIIAVFALVISALAYFDVRRSLRNQSSLTTREIELVRLQIGKENAAARAERSAFVSARIHRVTRSDWKVRVFNAGPAQANNVRLDLNEQNEIVHASFTRGKFPIGKLEKGQSVDIVAPVHMKTKNKETLRIIWDDDSGIDRENTVELTL